MNKLGKPTGPYAHAVISNNLVFVSGQLPINITTNQMIGDFEDAIHQVFFNLELVLNENQSNLNKIIKTTVYIKDNPNLDLDKLNLVYASKFKNYYPARSLVVVNRLPKNAVIMIDVIAEVK